MNDLLYENRELRCENSGLQNENRTLKRQNKELHKLLDVMKDIEQKYIALKLISDANIKELSDMKDESLALTKIATILKVMLPTISPEWKDEIVKFLEEFKELRKKS